MKEIIGIFLLVAPVLAALVPEIIKAKGLRNFATEFINQIKADRK